MREAEGRGENVARRHLGLKRENIGELTVTSFPSRGSTTRLGKRIFGRLTLAVFQFECGFLKFELTRSARLKDWHVMNGAKTINH